VGGPGDGNSYRYVFITLHEHKLQVRRGCGFRGKAIAESGGADLWKWCTPAFRRGGRVNLAEITVFAGGSTPSAIGSFGSVKAVHPIAAVVGVTVSQSWLGRTLVEHETERGPTYKNNPAQKGGNQEDSVMS
jgi:hypothetical protein